MQVKCYYTWSMLGHTPESLFARVEQRGKCLLGVFTDDNHEYPRGSHPDAPGEHISVGGENMTQLSALIVVGGRNSIINWLGLHGRNPKIRCYDGSDLQLYVVRKKHRTAKNLTMLVFTGSKCQLQGFGDPDDLCKWDRKEPDWGFTPQELSGMLPGILYRV